MNSYKYRIGFLFLRFFFVLSRPLDIPTKYMYTKVDLGGAVQV